jgi:hypothetical protein
MPVIDTSMVQETLDEVAIRLTKEECTRRGISPGEIAKLLCEEAQDDGRWHDYFLLSKPVKDWSISDLRYYVRILEGKTYGQ